MSGLLLCEVAGMQGWMFENTMGLRVLHVLIPDLRPRLLPGTPLSHLSLDRTVPLTEWSDPFACLRYLLRNRVGPGPFAAYWYWVCHRGCFGMAGALS